MTDDEDDDNDNKYDKNEDNDNDNYDVVHKTSGNISPLALITFLQNTDDNKKKKKNANNAHTDGDVNGQGL